MNLSEAKQTAKELSEALTVLVAATEGIKESDFTALHARKENLEAAIADTKKKLGEASIQAQEKITQAQANTDAKLVELDNQIKTAESALKALRADADVSSGKMRESIASERAVLLKEKSEVAARLDAQIASKLKQLSDIEAAVEAGRARFSV
jgi:hypothetical protein